MYLLDTNVISETRKPRPHQGVLAWIASVPTSDMYLCAVTMGELQKGIERTRRQDPQKAEEISRWVDLLASAYEITPVDGRIFREWATLMYGRSEDRWEDVLIAATARIHRWIVVTRNVIDFEDLDVKVLNPFSASAQGN